MSSEIGYSSGSSRLVKFSSQIFQADNYRTLACGSSHHVPRTYQVDPIYAFVQIDCLIKELPSGYIVVSVFGRPRRGGSRVIPLFGNATLPSFHMAKTGVCMLSIRASFITMIFCRVDGVLEIDDIDGVANEGNGLEVTEKELGLILYDGELGS